jgi:hypothetical protein
MSLRNLSSESDEHGGDFSGMALGHDGLGSVSAQESPHRESKREVESGLDGFVSEDMEPTSGSPLPISASWWPSVRDPTQQPIPDTEHAPAASQALNVPSIASRAIAHARNSVVGLSSRARIATVVPRLVQNVRLDRLWSTAALVGQTSARMTQSFSATLTRPRWRFDRRLVIPLVLATIGFGELWWVSHRFSNPAQSLAQNATIVALPPWSRRPATTSSQRTERAAPSSGCA